MLSRTEIPKGVKALLPVQAAQKREIENRLLSVFFRWGFQEIITPAFEYYDVLAPCLGADFEDQTIKVVDRESGRLLVLRPDITPQIARIAATVLKDHPKPLRFCYSSNVFRHHYPQVARQQEFYQAGVELIGLDLPEADVEMIAIAVESMKEAGLVDFKIAVSQVEYVRGLLKELGLSREKEEKIKTALRKKDRSGLETLLQEFDLSDAQRNVLLELPTLFGKEEVFARAEALANNPGSRAALENLVRVYEMLQVYGLEEYILLDLSEIRGFDYYTGVVFEGFTSHLGYGICSGGRYDHLIGKFAEECPSTGFAIDIERLILALEKQGTFRPGKAVDFLIIDFSPDKRNALRIAKELRARGFRVARDIIRRELAGSLAYARQMRIAQGIILGTPGLAADEVLLKEIDPPEREVKVKMDQIVAFVESQRGKQGDPPRR
ncbi:MAG: ATP phosphoribosyltransferase regulatory subunit [Nitrospinota bacterium]|nr:MAG: ATP phosphoribosyltransferase regulatory subunit [Nitrospinota bacterium]